MKQKMTVTFLGSMMQTISINGKVLDGPDMREALYNKSVVIPIDENGVKDFVIDYPEVLTPAKLAEEISAGNISWENINEVQHPSDLIDGNLNDYLSNDRKFRYTLLLFTASMLSILMVSSLEVVSIVLGTLLTAAVFTTTLRILNYFGFVKNNYILKHDAEVQTLLVWSILLPSALIIYKVFYYA